MVRSLFTVFVLSVLLSSCNLNWRDEPASGGSGGGGGDSPTLLSITVTPAHDSIVKSATSQFTAAGLYSDGLARDITSYVVWMSGTTSVATISETGFVVGVGAGTSVITAALGSISGSVVLTVTDPAALPPYSVYVVGGSLVGARSVAAIWKDGVRTILPSDDKYANATSVFVSEGHVYVSGYYQEVVGSVPVLWVDGVRTDLSSVAGQNASAVSVYVHSGHVYVAGYYNDGESDIAVVWRDGVRTDLERPLTATRSLSSSIYVSAAGNVYVAGFYDQGLSDHIAVTWKDGVRADFTVAGNQAYANSVFESGSSIYVAGQYSDGVNSIAAMWTNGVKTDLTVTGSNAYATNVYVDGSTVYVTGQADTAAVYWENGTRRTLDTPTGFVDAAASSTFVYDGSVYMAGYYINIAGKYIAALWKDGVRTDLSDPGDGAYAYSVYVSAN